MAKTAPEQSDLLKRYNALMAVGRYGSAALAVVVACVVIGWLTWARVQMYKESPDAPTSSRRERQATVFVLGLAVVGAGVIGLVAYGAVTVLLEPMKKRMLWSIYQVEGKERKLLVTGLTYDEVDGRVSQMENRQLGAIFEKSPE